jgi:hypothetical protein
LNLQRNTSGDTRKLRKLVRTCEGPTGSTKNITSKVKN